MSHNPVPYGKEMPRLTEHIGIQLYHSAILILHPSQDPFNNSLKSFEKNFRDSFRLNDIPQFLKLVEVQREIETNLVASPLHCPDADGDRT